MRLILKSGKVTKWGRFDQPDCGRPLKGLIVRKRLADKNRLSYHGKTMKAGKQLTYYFRLTYNDGTYNEGWYSTITSLSHNLDICLSKLTIKYFS